MDLQSGLWMLVTSSLCEGGSHQAQRSRPGSLSRWLQAVRSRLEARLSGAKRVAMIRMSWS